MDAENLGMQRRGNKRKERYTIKGDRAGRSIHPKKKKKIKGREDWEDPSILSLLWWPVKVCQGPTILKDLPK